MQSKSTQMDVYGAILKMNIYFFWILEKFRPRENDKKRTKKDSREHG